MVKVKPSTLIKRVLKRADVQAFIINLNTEDQLKKDNINPLGFRLYTIGGEYSNMTLELKNLRDPKQINLFDTGDYYETFDLLIFANGDFQIISNNKIHGSNTDLAKERWGEVEGLTKENEEKALRFIEEKLIEEIERLF